MSDPIKLFHEIHEEVASLDVVDVHTHLRWDNPQARSLAEIVFYHFVAFELCSAGMPGVDMSKAKGDPKMVRKALPWLPLIRFRWPRGTRTRAATATCSCR